MDALPPVVEKYPNLCYIVLGATHPNILREDGESYRLSLQRQARNLNLQRNVLFSNRFVGVDKLCEFLKAADVYITPYLNREQITSGTLAFALGAGKPIISTPYWYAEELLADGRGLLVDFRDSAAIGEAILRLLESPGLVRDMRAKAYEFSRRMTWHEVGQRYLDSFREAISTARVRASTPEHQPAPPPAHYGAAPAAPGPHQPADGRHRHPAARALRDPRPFARLLHGR